MEDGPLAEIGRHSKKRAFRRAFKAFLIVLLSACFVLAFFLGTEEVFAEKYLPNTQIGSLHLGGKTQAQAREEINKIAATAEKQTFVMSNGKGDTFAATAKELGMSVDTDGAIKKAFIHGHKGPIYERAEAYIKSSVIAQKVTLTWKFDDETLQDAIRAKAKEMETDPKNAVLKVADGNISVEPNSAGRRVNVDQLIVTLKQNLPEKVVENQAPASTPFEFYELQPPVTTGYAEDLAAQLQSIAAEDFKITSEGKTFTVPKAELLNWFTITPRDNTIEVTLAQNKINEKLAQIAKSVEKTAKPKKISTKDGSVLEEGQDGLKINREQAFAAISQALSLEGKVNHNVSLTTAVVPAGEKRVTPEETFTPGLYPGKYIEINLSKQTLAAFDGESKFMQTGVSTGKWSMPTPTGTFSINAKNPRAYSATYGLYMPYWMSFIGSQYGIHELPEWPSGYKEGEGHIGTPVSHGCVRLGVGPAQQLYNWAEVGTIVYAHK